MDKQTRNGVVCAAHQVMGAAEALVSVETEGNQEQLEPVIMGLVATASQLLGMVSAQMLAKPNGTYPKPAEHSKK